MAMNKSNGIISLIFALAMAGSAIGAATERFPWLGDLDEARELASEQGKPLLIVFRCEP